jgi:hypothetical protein
VKRPSAAQLLETATFVVLISIPPAIAELNTAMPWWAMILSRLSNALLNAWTLLYCASFGAWIRSKVNFGKAPSELAAILLMQVPAFYLFLLGLNQLLSKQQETYAVPLSITVGLCVLMWAWEAAICPFLERRVPWLARLAKNPASAARGVALRVGRGGRAVGRVLAHVTNQEGSKQ